MPARLPGTAYGPGFSVHGTPAEFDISDYGLRLITEEEHDGAPPWSEVAVKRAAVGDELLLEWAGSAGNYAIRVADADAIRAVTAIAAPATSTHIARGEPSASGLPRRLIWIAIAVAALVTAMLLWQKDRLTASPAALHDAPTLPTG